MKKLMTNIFRLTIVLSVLLATASCVKYSFRGALPSSIKTIAIPLFEDKSNWVGVQEQLTNAVINAFVEDNSLQVVDNEDEGDLVLRGTILSVRPQTTSVSGNETTTEERYVVTVKIECYNRQTDKLLWSGNLSDYGVVSGAATLAEQEAAIAIAIEKLKIEIVNRTIAAW
jgi:outer membrane lipopolysaccharide assembly protein LptE/RlpB